MSEQEEQNNVDAPNLTLPEAPQLTYEEACALLKRHGRLISEDDVELVVLVTLHNEFMRLVHERLAVADAGMVERNTKHQAAITEIMKRSVDEMRKGMAAERDAFASAMRSVALENVTALISQHQQDMAEHRQTVRFCTFLCCACLAVMVFILMRWL